MSMHDITKHELSSIMYYDIRNSIMNPMECLNIVMYVFIEVTLIPCKRRF